MFLIPFPSPLFLLGMVKFLRVRAPITWEDVRVGAPIAWEELTVGAPIAWEELRVRAPIAWEELRDGSAISLLLPSVSMVLA